MKELFIIRHGKATHQPMPDVERFLTEKGIKRTEKHAIILREKNLCPDAIVSSPAKRAFQTAEILADICNFPKSQIIIMPDFYFMPEGLVYNQIQSLPNTANRIFITGHNPLWTDLADELSSQDIWHLRTSGVVGIAFDADTWYDVFRAPRKDIIIIN